MTQTDIKEKDRLDQTKIEAFIQKALITHGYKYDYSITRYKGYRAKVEIRCPDHGLFEQRIDSHLSGQGCPECSGNRKHTIKTFIKKANNIHNGKYDYSKAVYVNNETKLEIICKIHGSFWQVPQSHFFGSGCHECSNLRVAESQLLDTNTFIERSREIHGHTYDYSKTNYVYCKTDVVITCKEHGDYLQKPYLHLFGGGCHKCAIIKSALTRSDTQEDFVSKAANIHGDKFIYNKVKYKNHRTKVEIVCRVHGSFFQKPKDHLMGSGCKWCCAELVGFNRGKYLQVSKKYDGHAKLYIIKCFDEDEIFYKVGITVTPIEQRYKKGALPYEYEVLTVLEGEAGFVWDLEKRLHTIMKDIRYEPRKYFGGYTECFKNIPNSIMKLLSQIKQEDQLQLIA
ncbi:hypothetical protein [Acinetobacter ursingii]|uniref:hypothetical protein n=1 Tax=Acinetobacter ursingii TaxID=108980 RepID=UPI000E6A9BEF|nr:hypothetical protein [Acinetobacter ursingii]